MSVTIQDRLTAATQGLVLLRAALAADEDRLHFDRQDVISALEPHAAEISEQIHWLKCALSESVLQTPAPTDDERAEQDDLGDVGA